MAAYSLELNRNETEIFGLDQYREYQYQEPVFYNNPFLINDPVVQLLEIVSLPAYHSLLPVPLALVLQSGDFISCV